MKSPWPLSTVKSRMLDLVRRTTAKQRTWAKREILWKSSLKVQPCTQDFAAEVFLFQALSALWCSLPFLDLHDAPELVNGPDLRQVTCLNLEVKKWRYWHLTSCVLQTSLTFYCKLAKPNLVLCCWYTSTSPLPRGVCLLLNHWTFILKVRNQITLIMIIL